jgi:hypothetical protein
MKFDIFDSSTWNNKKIDNQKRIRDSILGQIGNLIPQIRKLQKEIRDKVECNNPEDSFEYMTAIELSDEVKKIFEISIEYPTTKAAEVLHKIDVFLNKYNDNVNRQYNYLLFVDMLKEIKPYLFENDRKVFDLVESKNNIDADFSVKVSGNAAWDKYIENVKYMNSMLNYYKAKVKRQEELLNVCDCEDCNNEDCNNEDCNNEDCDSIDYDD